MKGNNMLYSHVYKKHYPIQHGADVLMLDEEERSRLAKCIRGFPNHVQAWFIETLHRKRIKQSDVSWFGTNLATLRKECAELSDKILSGCILTEEEVKSLNWILYANKYNWFLTVFLPSRFHLERMYMFTRKPTIGG